MKLLKLPFYLIILLSLWACQKNFTRTSTNVDKSLTAVIVEKEDQTAIKTIEPYKNQLDDKMNEVIGFAPTELTEAEYQSTLGNFIIDLILIQTEKTWNQKVDMAVVTNGGLRTPIPEGNVTVGNIFELMPFNNEIVVLELKGETVIKMMDYGASKKNAVFAGVTYKVVNEKAETILIGGQPINSDKIYTLAVSDYLAGGGDKMTFLTESIKTHKVGILFRDAIINHIKELTSEKKQIIGKLNDRTIIVE